MSPEDASHPTLRDLAAEIGQVQIFWSFLESDIRRQLDAAGRGEKALRGPIIAHWRAYMRDLTDKAKGNGFSTLLDDVERTAKLRNLIAHGIQSVSANPWESRSAFVVCVAPDGSERTITIEGLRTLSEEIEKIRFAMCRLGF